MEVETGLRSAVRSSPLPGGLVDLLDSRFIEMSRSAVELLGLSSERYGESTLLDFTPDVQLLRETLARIADGALDGFESSRLVRTPDRTGPGFCARLRAFGPPPRRYAVAVFEPAGAGARSSADALQTFVPPSAGSSAVVGSVDDEWRIERISREVAVLLGWDANAVVSLPILGAVHPSDALDFITAGMLTRTNRAVVAVHVRTRHVDGAWRSMQMQSVPRVDPGQGGFGFVLTPRGADNAQSTAERLMQLERHLWRIALEVNSAGALARQPSAVPGRLPSLIGELSGRQWEVLNRLSQGQRVPAIAREMFLSPSTVRNHLTAIFRKVGVTSQEELLARLRD